VFNILLQVLDDGRLTDNKGRVVNFKNTIIIMTSNLGSNLIRENFEKITPKNREEIIEDTKNQVMGMLKTTIRPEFLNRIDDIIVFAPLKEEEIEQIVRLQLDGVSKMLAENGITLTYTEEAVKSIAQSGYDPEFVLVPLNVLFNVRCLTNCRKIYLPERWTNSKPIISMPLMMQVFFKN